MRIYITKKEKESLVFILSQFENTHEHQEKEDMHENSLGENDLKTARSVLIKLRNDGGFLCRGCKKRLLSG